MDIEEILRQRASIFDRALNGNLTPRDPKIFYDALRYVPLSGGKRLRPIIAMLACEVVGGVPENTIPFGVSLEYMHNSTLVHDDIIDNDRWRRGMPTTHEKFGLPFAILAGDALIGETYKMLSYLAPPELNSVTYKELIRSIADAAKNFYEGEALDIEFAKRFDVSIPEYMIMIEKKTGQLYYLAGKGGALIGKGNRKEIENLAKYGLLFGLMFQMKDDLLNILTKQSSLGKQLIGSDILNGKRTLMVVHAITEANENQKNKLHRILGNPKATQNDVLDIIDLFRKLGSIDYAQNKLDEFSAQARESLKIFEKSESKDLLTALAEYSVTRHY
jgi:geranylgeranyl diphosphate synthase type I